MEQANLGIGTIGQRLESARQSKGVSVSEAGQATKILTKFIEAMEADDFGALSAPVYAKSFIKMYAKYLGLEAQPLVDEYVAQHVPKSKLHMTEEVRQNLTQVDHVAADGNGGVPPASDRGKGTIFGGVQAAAVQLGNGIAPKTLMIAAAALLLIVIFAVGVKQCVNDGEDAPAPAGGAARVEREVLMEELPNVYLVKPGEIAVEH